jgi:hypothetical protein
VQLIPQQTEQEQLDMTDAQYAIWLRLRKLVYACKLALASGPIVPADALAQPHVFAAAALQTTTKLNSLASAKQLAQLLTYIWNFTRVEFGGDPHGDKYIQYPPISLAAVQAGADLFDLYLSIYITMFPVGRR